MGGLLEFSLVFFARTFLRQYLNKVDFICFAKVCKFHIARIVLQLSQSGNKTEKAKFEHALRLFQKKQKQISK